MRRQINFAFAERLPPSEEQFDLLPCQAKSIVTKRRQPIDLGVIVLFLVKNILKPMGPPAVIGYSGSWPVPVFMDHMYIFETLLRHSHQVASIFHSWTPWSQSTFATHSFSSVEYVTVASPSSSIQCKWTSRPSRVRVYPARGDVAHVAVEVQRLRVVQIGVQDSFRQPPCELVLESPVVPGPPVPPAFCCCVQERHGITGVAAVVLPWGAGCVASRSLSLSWQDRQYALPVVGQGRGRHRWLLKLGCSAHSCKDSGIGDHGGSNLFSFNRFRLGSA